MLGVGQNLVVHHAKTSVFAGSTLPRLQHVQVHLLLGVVESLANTLTAAFVALRAPAAVCLTIETHKTVSFPFDFEQARFTLVVGGVLRRVVARKPLVEGCKLAPLVGLDQLFQRVAIGIHFQVLKVSPIQKGVDSMVACVAWRM